MPEAKIKFTTYLTPTEAEALVKIEESSPFAGIKTDRNTLIRFIILDYLRLLENPPIGRADWEEIKNTLMAGGKMRSLPAPKESYREKKAREEAEERERAMEFAKALNGRVEGDICYFEKYEITAGGLVKHWGVSENIFNLSEKVIADQYYPSRSEWEEADRKENGEG